MHRQAAASRTHASHSEQAATGHSEAAERSASEWLGFLSAEDTVAWRAPGELSRDLAESFCAPDDQSVFVAANRLALEAFHARDLPLAARICGQQIGYADARLREGGDERLALLGLQPVINLIRLNGYAGDIGLALDGLAQLEQVADGLPARILGLGLIDRPKPPVAARVRALARNNRVVETAKILWRRGRTVDLLAECGRLTRKWPGCLTAGPHHCAEAPWLVDADGSLDAIGLPDQSVLRRICSLHLLSQAPPSRRADFIRTGRELFSGRAAATAGKPAGAAARDLASLGDSLIRLGQHLDGIACLAQAHGAATPADPVLANLIRTRWLEHARNEPHHFAGHESPVPPELSCKRLSRDDLAAAASLAATRLGY